MKSYFDIAGDGGSEILGQVTDQRARIQRQLSGVKCMLAIGSGKGGVGKSTLTFQIASALLRADKRCAVLDADLNGPSQARMAGIGSVPFVPGAEGLTLPSNADGLGVVSLGSVIPESEALEFDSVARGDSHTWRATREFAAVAELMGAIAWGELDFLLVDLPPGAERTFQYAEFLGPETAILLVTLPSAVSRSVVARSVAALDRTPNPLLGYVENMAGYYCSDCDAVKPLFPSADDVQLGIPCLGRIPFDPELAATSDTGTPAATSRPAALAVARLVDRLLEAPEIKR